MKKKITGILIDTEANTAKAVTIDNTLEDTTPPCTVPVLTLWSAPLEKAKSISPSFAMMRDCSKLPPVSVLFLTSANRCLSAVYSLQISTMIQATLLLCLSRSRSMCLTTSFSP